MLTSVYYYGYYRPYILNSLPKIGEGKRKTKTDAAPDPLQQETFVFNTNLQLTQAWHEIQKARELMQRDDEIINLRQRVKTAGESKYAHGVYTVNDLVKDINAENRSRQAKVLHEVQYLMCVYQYRVIAGE